MRRSDLEHVAAAREHLAALRRHLERGDLSDDTIFDAVCMRLSAAIDSVAMVDDSRRTRAYGDVWPAIWSVRNRIAHGYVFVDRAIITATVDTDLGELEEGLRSIELDAAPPSDPPAPPDLSFRWHGLQGVESQVVVSWGEGHVGFEGTTTLEINSPRYPGASRPSSNQGTTPMSEGSA